MNGTDLSVAQREGFCAVADILGADSAASPGPLNPLDGKPEVVVVANGYLLVLDSGTGKILRSQNLQDGTSATFDCVGSSTKCVSGGSPNIDDFDGDGYPEVATAMQKFYQVVDFQAPEATNCPAWPAALDKSGAPPQTNPVRNPGAACKADADCNAGAVCNEKIGSCVCLHNGWKRNTEDDSSAVTSSSVFDFNGDGAAEVVYSDECYFRVYNGTNGGVYLQVPAVNRTLVDNPVVADVDNDGNAEIVIVQNNAALQCGTDNLDKWPTGSGTVAKTALPNGIEVFGDSSDAWVAARRVWNEHAYHVTNVLESGRIPAHEPESWKPWNGRFYNTYRSQPRNYDVAPDLTPTGVQVFSPNVACGKLSDEIQITALVRNQGDLRVGPGVTVEFFGISAR
ncbi:MAG: VCBS repeat-containing protein [Polyangiaceae bacterium]